jgi:hypothetical protein
MQYNPVTLCRDLRKEAKLINTGYLPLELGGMDLFQPIYIALLT